MQSIFDRKKELQRELDNINKQIEEEQEKKFELLGDLKNAAIQAVEAYNKKAEEVGLDSGLALILGDGRAEDNNQAILAELDRVKDEINSLVNKYNTIASNQNICITSAKVIYDDDIEKFESYIDSYDDWQSSTWYSSKCEY